MPVSDIYSGNALIQPKSIQDFDNEAMMAQGKRQQLQQNALAMQGTRMQLQQQQNVLAQRSAMANALQSGGVDINNPAHQANLVAQYPDVAPAFLDTVQKSQTARALASKDTAQAAHANAQAQGAITDNTIKGVEFMTRSMPTNGDPQALAQWYKSGIDQKMIDPQQAAAEFQQIPFGDPKAMAAWSQQQQAKGVSLLEKMKLAQQAQIAEANNATSRANNDATNKTHIQTTAMTNATTRRGQDLTDARTRESTVATMTKPFEVTGPDGTPLLVQQDKQGNITPVTGYGPKVGSAKPLNDSQAKALGFGTRMQEADKLLNTLEARGVSTPSMPKMLVGDTPILGAVANMASSPDQQSVDQAQRDFVNAILRRESGAAISSSEFDNARKQYFSQPGDSKQVKDQKAANRKLAMEGVIAEVPVGQRGTIGPGAKTAAAPAANGWSYVGPVK